MHKVIAALLVVGLASVSNAQFRTGDLELSLSGSAGRWTITTKSTGYEDSESRSYLYLGISPGFFLANGVSIEPEVAMGAMESAYPAWFVLGNLSFTFSNESGSLGPFVRAGYGISNSIFPVPGTYAIARISNKMNVQVLNLGIGLKVRIVGSAYLRSEVNYKRYSWSEELSGYAGYRSTTDYSDTNIGLLFGLSVVI